MDILLGIGYNKIYPEVIHTLPSGLQILKSRFLPAIQGEVCCVGGPLGAAQNLVNNIGARASMSYLAHLMSGYNNYKSKVDFFPSIYLKPRELSKEAVDKNIPQVEEYLRMSSDDDDEDIDDEEVLKEGDREKLTEEMLLKVYIF